MGKPRSVFQQKQPEGRTLNLKVPAALHARMQSVKTRLEALDKGLIFNASAIVTAALEAALKAAEQELAALEQRASPRRVAASAEAPLTGERGPG